jgi:hypothetical protein
MSIVNNTDGTSRTHARSYHFCLPSDMCADDAGGLSTTKFDHFGCDATIYSGKDKDYYVSLHYPNVRRIVSITIMVHTVFPDTVVFAEALSRKHPDIIKWDKIIVPCKKVDSPRPSCRASKQELMQVQEAIVVHAEEESKDSYLKDRLLKWREDCHEYERLKKRVKLVKSAMHDMFKALEEE